MTSPPASERMTLLGDPLTQEEEQKLREKHRIEEENRGKARELVFEVWLDAYKAGDVGLELMLRHAHNALLRVDAWYRQRTLGHLVELALSTKPAKRSRGNKGQPEGIRKIAVRLVDQVVEREKLPKSRIGKGQTAFERAAQILDEIGVSTTPRQIEDWCYIPK